MEDSQAIGRTKGLLAEEVFNRLGMAIVNGELAPRERIRDAELAVELHVSRMPVREALQRLERIGLVTMYPSRYTEVTEVSEEIIAQSREFAGFQAGIAARLACLRMTDAQRDGVDALIDALVSGADDLIAHSLARRDLFNHLARLTGNTLQFGLMDESSLALARNLKGALPGDHDPAHARDLYEQLRAALHETDADAAERISRAIHGCA